MLKLRYEDVTWSIPFFFNEDVLGLSLLKIIRHNNINLKFEVYGSTICSWSKSEQNFLETTNKLFIEKNIDVFKLQNAIPTFLFDKFNINGQELKDKFCNEVLDKAIAESCNFIVSSDKLLKHIKNSNEKACCIASVQVPELKFQNDIEKNKCNPKNELKFYNELLKKYDRIIIRPEFVKSGMLEEIQDLSKVEVIINPQVQGQHFDLNSEYSLSFEEMDKLVNLGVKHFHILNNIQENNAVLINTVINLIFKQNMDAINLFKLTIKSFDEVKYFYINEVIKDIKINNIKFDKIYN